MSQSNIIFGFLFAAFVIFITQRGELPVYLGFLLATPKVAPDPTSANNVDTAKLASNVIQFAALV